MMKGLPWVRGSTPWVIGLVLCTACTKQPPTDAVQAIGRLMADQEAAWDRGDIPGFMEAYDEQVCFLSPRGTTCGRDRVTANYQRSYPDRAAMGDLSFSVGEVLPVGIDHAWCTGTWTLYRTQDTLSGGFSLLWHRRTDGWRILRDHTY